MLFKGKYLIGHILVALIAISCFFLSSWQFSRLEERKELNSRIESRMSSKVVELEEIANPNLSNAEQKEIEYRTVSVKGTFDPEVEVLISGRAKDGSPGYNVVTLLRIDNSDDSIFINRGWIPQQLGDDIRYEKIDNEIIQPDGGFDTSQKVTGIIRLNEQKAVLGGLQEISDDNVSIRIDINLFEDIAEEENLYPFYIQAFSQKTNNSNEYPIALSKPELSERNHLSYALQWIAFGLIAIVTWVIICVKAVKKKAVK